MSKDTKERLRHTQSERENLYTPSLPSLVLPAVQSFEVWLAKPFSRWGRRGADSDDTTQIFAQERYENKLASAARKLYSRILSPPRH